MSIDRKEILEKVIVELENIADKSVRNIIILLFNIIEEDTRILQELKEENQKLRDEINR